MIIIIIYSVKISKSILRRFIYLLTIIIILNKCSYYIDSNYIPYYICSLTIVTLFCYNYSNIIFSTHIYVLYVGSDLQNSFVNWKLTLLHNFDIKWVYKWIIIIVSFFKDVLFSYYNFCKI